MKTVFFGPFVGEFGWELTYWQGWVRDVSRTIFQDYHKIVSSHAGRYPLYPDADEFWPNPDWLSARNYSQRGYITDYWKKGLPIASNKVLKYRFGIFPRYTTVPVRAEKKQQDASLPILDLLDAYKKNLPSDTVYFTPFLLNKCPKYNISFGTYVSPNPNSDSDFQPYRIDLKYQVLEKIKPTTKGKEAFFSLRKDKKKIIAIFPRKRDYRRPNLNWSQDKYSYLIKSLQQHFSNCVVAIFGEQGGAYYADGVPEGCLDLINVDSLIRMDIQVAALEESVLALGGLSGAIMFALACGCPSLTFGLPELKIRYYQENFLGTKFVYFPFMQAEPEEIFRLAEGMINSKIPPDNNWDPLDYFGKRYKYKKKIMHFIKDRISNFTL